MRTWLAPLAFGVLGGAACFVELDPPAASDAGADATIDAGFDAGVDACAVSRVQAARANTLTGTTDHIAVTLDTPANAGDFFAVGVNYVSCTPVQKIADTAGNAYQQIIAAE